MISVALVNGGSAVLYGWPSGMPDIDKDLLKQRKIKFAHDALNDYPQLMRIWNHEKQQAVSF
ncbi:hypothetical protein SAMN05518672_1011214 [Chitinophaga sp. CF118]|uniref:hypothetical protein n=1 Tax=Chitinophaga sp. CF118 TaxID=1884367 RepID=UPI0008F25534|nr:hypothetical protein [Chitinophaga sp. CF118]SFD24168.1 hypothetical protein SAMN05518672_1011214 [Chitinophaga sp. CF118]